MYILRGRRDKGRRKDLYLGIYIMENRNLFSLALE